MSKLSKIVIVLILAVGLGVGVFFIWKGNSSDDEQNNIASQVNDENKQNSSKNEYSSDEELVKALYLEKLSKDSLYDDYRVDEVQALTDEEKKETVEWDGGQNYKETDILAYVRYSVKTVDGEYDLAGNGEPSGDWTINKSVCVCVRDGKIQSEGTGW